MKTFTSTTSWQCDPDWNIEINVRGFRTAKDAALFGMGNGLTQRRNCYWKTGN